MLRPGEEPSEGAHPSSLNRHRDGIMCEQGLRKEPAVRSLAGHRLYEVGGVMTYDMTNQHDASHWA